MQSNNESTHSRPGRPGLLFEDYEKAYLELTGSDGSPPSQRQLRKYLGTGSNTTLASYRRRIAEEQVLDQKPLEPGSIDAELLTTVQRLASQIQMVEAQLADDRVVEVQKQADQRVNIAEATMEKRLRDTDLLEYRATQAEGDLKELRTKLEDSETALKMTKNEHQTLQLESTTLMQTASETDRQVAQLTRDLVEKQDDLKNVLKEKEAAIQDSTEMAAKWITNEERLQAQLFDAQSALATMTEKHSLLNERLNERDQVIEMQKNQQNELQQCLSQLTSSLDSTQTLLDEARSERESSFRQCNELSNEIKTTERLTKIERERLLESSEEKQLQIEHLQSLVTNLSKQKIVVTE